jgi:hypothetical protein
MNESHALCASLALAALFLPGQGLADAAAPQPYRLRGGVSCGDAVHTLATRESDVQAHVDSLQLVEWVWGYLAAYNARGAFDDAKRVRAVPSIEPPDDQTVILFIEGYCRKHPTTAVTNAAHALIRTLGGNVYIPLGLE